MKIVASSDGKRTAIMHAWENGHAQARLGRFHDAARLEHRIDGTASQNVSQSATRCCDCGHASPVAGSGGNAGCAKILAGQALVRRWRVPNPSVRYGRGSQVKGAIPGGKKRERTAAPTRGYRGGVRASVIGLFPSAPSLFGGFGDPQARTAAAKPAVAGLPDLMALLARQVQPLRPVVLLGATEAAHILARDRLNRRGGRTNEHCGCNQHHGPF